MKAADVWLARRKGKRRTTYAVRWIDPETGKVRCKSCGSDRAAAEAFRVDKRRDLRAGIRGEIRPVTWAEFVTEDVQLLTDADGYRHGRSHKHVTGTRATLTRFGKVCNPAGPAAVTTRMIEKYVTHLRARKLAPSTINKHLRELKAALGRAKDREYVRELPVFRMLRVKKGLLRTLDTAEKAALLDACPDLCWRAAVLLAMKAGLRRGELLALTWDRLRLDVGQAKVIGSKGHDRVVPLVSSVVSALRDLRAEGRRIGGRVFVRGDGRAWTDAYIGQTVREIVRTAGIAHCTLHDLRRTFLTDLARGHVNQTVCQALAGHVSPATTSRYYQAVDDEMCRAAVAVLDDNAGAA